MDEIIQLKITLDRTKPPIWRRVLVDKRITFLELHQIIQVVMGWENYHLYDFKFDKLTITEDYEEFYESEFDTNKTLDSNDVTLDQILTRTKERFYYEYDFGDSWVHKIIVEKFLPRDIKTSYPICIGGKLNCPPEDCGGIPGFYNLLDILSKKSNPEREELIEWIGGEYDPEYFDIEEVNNILRNFE